jgi:outer membrane protein OmpA-like peptidoglycan-associated protein
MKIEISGHTDSKGSDTYNEVLSRKRAQAVVNWLVANGISRDRLTYEGYGESRPLASNDDEEEGRELNRRTEFKIIKR